MTDRMQNTINHINTSADVDKWAVDEVIKVFESFDKIKALEQEPCEDVVSRQAVEEIINDIRDYISVEGYWAILERMKKLPSFNPQPKMGRWIDAVIPNGNGSLPVQVCNQCNTFFPLAYTGGGHRFCPNCGTKMESEG